MENRPVFFLNTYVNLHTENHQKDHSDPFDLDLKIEKRSKQQPPHETGSHGCVYYTKHCPRSRSCRASKCCVLA